jgi:hypothetical protein
MRSGAVKCVIATAFLVIPFVLAGCDVAHPIRSRPSDQEMINNFHDHKAEFETVARMFREDRVVRRMQGSLSPAITPGSEGEEAVKAGISSQRVFEYSRLIDAVGATRNVYYNVGTDTTLFIIYAPGLAGMVGVEGKNIIYSPKKERSPVVPDTDEYKPAPGHEDESVYRRIEGPWYIEHSFL